MENKQETNKQTVNAQREVLALKRSDRTRVSKRRIWIWSIVMAILLGVFGLQAMFPEQRFLPQMSSGVSDSMFLLLFVGALFCEFVDSSLGMGYGTTLTPLLLLFGFDPFVVVPAVLFSEFVTGVLAGVFHHHDGNVNLVKDKQVRGTVILLASLSVVGIVVAHYVTVAIPKVWLKGIIAIIVISVGFVVLATIRRQLVFKRAHIVVLGSIAAFNKALSGGGYGPLVTGGQVVSGMSAKQAVAITSLAEAFVCAVALILRAFVSDKGMDWTLVLPLTLGAVMSVPMATLTIKKLSPTVARTCVGVSTCALGVWMAIKLIA